MEYEDVHALLEVSSDKGALAAAAALDARIAVSDVPSVHATPWLLDNTWATHR
ncbi:MAG: hypothetical protein RMJ54_08910 [Roseiflexaceae bacterium]|nr:hypothetical protein [Roseiflexus sp.]MDW8145635.1 hypothetical protein [Roseiflexaceae bacterium]MDW8232890.1 hypothetical protein [Roseiflexaceae bacterium]